MAHINKRTTAAGKARWDVRWKALGRWQTKTFQRRQDADAFRRTVEADELRGVVVDVRRSSGQLVLGPSRRGGSGSSPPTGPPPSGGPIAALSQPRRRRPTTTCCTA